MEPFQDVLALLLAVRVVQVHARVPLFFEHRLHLLGGVDAVVEDERLGAFGLFLVSVEQLLLHQEIAVQTLGGADSVVSIDAHFQRAQVDVVAVSLGPSEEAVFHQVADGFSHDQLGVVVVQRQLDVARQWRGRDAQQHLLAEVLEELAEAVVVGFVHHHQPQVLEPNPLVVEAVVQRFHHGHKAPVVAAVVEFLDLAVDDLVGDPDFRQHRGGLPQQFNAVGQNEHTLACLQDVPLGEFRKDHRLAASCGELVEEVVAFREFLNARQDGVDRLDLIPIELLAFFVPHAVRNLGVDRKGFL